MNELKVTVSGSFTRHIDEVQRDVNEFKTLGVRVLSPAQPYVVDALDGFVFVESDRHRSVRLVQDRHLAAIAASDLLWLVCPDGYVGQSASLELGFAIALGIPVYSSGRPVDLTLRQYVQNVTCLRNAIVRASSRVQVAETLLIDPITATDTAASAISNIRELLIPPSGKTRAASLAREVQREVKRVQSAVSMPSKA